MPPQRASSLLKRSGSSASQVAIHQLVDGLHSPIQLAAISNYKLAQLTFAPPDMHSLRKTALIKNTVEYIYNITPPEWLDEMTRWEFFTLESLDEVDMTQEALETILSEYVQIMESFKSMRQDPSYLDDPALDTPTKEIQPPRRTTSVTSNDSCTSVSSSSIDTPIGTASSSPALTPAKPKDNKPPSLTIPSSGPSTLLSPTSPTSPNPMLQEQRRKSFRLNHHRISWTSDTGLSSFAASQHLAGELMSLFDMEFKIDISLNTNSAISSVAPQLPELSYFQEKKNNRSSVDSFMCLIPAFESFSIDGFEGASFVSRANKRTSIISSHRRSSLGTSPVRSSSLKYKNRAALASSGHASSTHPPMPTEPTAKKNSLANKSLSKKTSIRRLVSMFGKKKMEVDASAKPSLPQPRHHHPSPHQSQHRPPQYHPPSHHQQPRHQQPPHHQQPHHQHNHHLQHQQPRYPKQLSPQSRSPVSPAHPPASSPTSPYHAIAPNAANASNHSIGSYQSVDTVENEPRIATIVPLQSTHATTSVKQPLPPSSPIGATSPAPAAVTTRAQRRRSKSLSSLNPPLPLLTTNIHHNIPAATSPSPKDASPVNLSAILSHSTSAQDLSPRPDQHTSSPRQTRPIPSFYSQQELRQVQSSTDLADYARVANGSASTDSLGKKQNFMQRMASLATRRKKTFKMNTLPPISA